MSSPRAASQVERAQALGDRVRALRRGRKLKQSELAAQIHMSPSSLSRLENAVHGPPPDEVIVKLAKALETDTEELFRLAGRNIGGPSFERQVLGELRQLRRELRAGFDRIEATIAALRAERQA